MRGAHGLTYPQDHVIGSVRTPDMTALWSSGEFQKSSSQAPRTRYLGIACFPTSYTTVEHVEQHEQPQASYRVPAVLPLAREYPLIKACSPEPRRVTDSNISNMALSEEDRRRRRASDVSAPKSLATIQAQRLFVHELTTAEQELRSLGERMGQGEAPRPQGFGRQAERGDHRGHQCLGRL